MIEPKSRRRGLSPGAEFFFFGDLFHFLLVAGGGGDVSRHLSPTQV